MDNFIVSARKYRPATFESIVGQRHITSTLQNAISRSQLAHAYLFCGPRGVGKTTCARIFAKAINCLSPEGNEACGKCESCLGFAEGRSFNIHELDAASNNSVDDIRALTDQVRIPPQIGRYSVYIIDEVHMLSTQAFNAFLKTLEEPPAHAVFILATTEKHKIIPTILSRCQIFDFNRIRVEDSVDYLSRIASREGVACDDESLHLIAQKADGGMRDALSMFDKAVSFCGGNLCFKEVAQTLNVLDYDTYFNITGSILAGDYPPALSAFDELLRKGFSGQTFVTGLNTHFRDLLMCKNTQTDGLLEVSGSLRERYRQQAAECDTAFLFNAIALLTPLDGALRTATNPRLNVELALLKLCALNEKKKEFPVAADKEPESPADTLPAKRPDARNSAGVKSPAPVRQNKPTEVESAPAKEQVPAPAPEKAASSAKHVKPESPGTELKTVVKNGNGKPTISGTSINDLMGGKARQTKEAAGNDNGEESIPAATKVDPDSEAKIIGAKNPFIEALKSERPRIAVAMESMAVSGNSITLDVPTEALSEEILRNRTEILDILIGLSGVDGDIGLEVNVREDKTARRLVRSEDKLKHMADRNPALNMLRQALDMDIE